MDLRQRVPGSAQLTLLCNRFSARWTSSLHCGFGPSMIMICPLYVTIPTLTSWSFNPAYSVSREPVVQGFLFRMTMCFQTLCLLCMILRVVSYIRSGGGSSLG